MSASRIPIYREIEEERMRQALKFPHDERGLGLFKAVAILSEEAGEVSRAALACDEIRCEPNASHADELAFDQALRGELIHVAAVAVKLVELLDARLLRVPDLEEEE